MYDSFIVSEKQRGLLIRDGRFIRMLEPGRHRLFDPLHRYEYELFDATGIFASPWAELIAKRHPDIAADYFTTIQVDEGKVAVVRLDGRASFIARPGETIYVWTVVKAVTVEIFDLVEQPRLSREQLIAFEKATTVLPTPLANIAVVTVGEAEEALVFFDGELVEVVGPGRYGYWQIGRKVTAKTVETRPLPVEVTAQEILTRDKVSLRVTLTAFVKVIDVRQAALATPDFQAHVYKLVQFAVREAIGGRTLDQVLNDRVSVDRQIVEHVRAAIGDTGVAVTELGIKDVILPGDMRELINRVVEAEKTAEANLIRRREETAATRSLLNTAKLMEDNPLLLRLKELESLERVTEKIGRIDVHASSGEGLNAILDRLVTLRERD